MPRPVFSNGTQTLFPGASHSFNFTHSGGRVCVWVISMLGGTTLPTITFNGVAGSAVYAYPTPIWRVFTSAAAIAAGTVTVAFSGLTPGHQTFALLASVANWTGTVRASSNASSTTYQHVGTAVTADETFMANWLESAADFPTDGVYPSLIPDNAETFQVAQTGWDISGDVRQFIVFRSSATGTATAKVLEANFANSGFGNSSISMIFIGTTTQLFNQSVGGNLNFSGALTRQSLRGKPLTGNLSFSGILAAKSLRLRALTGTLSFGGALQASVQRVMALAGVLSFSGALQRGSTRTLSGVLSWVGTLTAAKKLADKDVAGSLDFQGSLTQASVFGRILDGTLSFLGEVGTFFIKAPRRFVVALFAQLTVVHNRLRR